MKSSTRFSLLATVVIAFGSLSTAALAATATGTANATVLTPMAIAATTALNFGTFSANASGGTVVVTSGGARSQTGTVALSSGTPGTNATFTVTGTGASTFAITYPGSFNVTGPGTAMPVTVVGAATGTLSGGSLVLPVGGTLTVGAAQLAGAYTGTYIMKVEYN